MHSRTAASRYVVARNGPLSVPLQACHALTVRSAPQGWGAAFVSAYVVFVAMVMSIHLRILGPAENSSDHGGKRIAWPFQKSIVFWPLFSMAGAAVLLLVNDSYHRRDVTFNAVSVVVALATSYTLWSCDYTHMFMDLRRADTQDDKSSQDDHEKDLRNSRMGYFQAIALLVLWYSIQGPSFSGDSSSNTRTPLGISSLLLFLIVVLEHRGLRKHVGNKADRDNGVSRDDRSGVIRGYIDFLARLVLTIAICVDVSGMDRHDNALMELPTGL